MPTESNTRHVLVNRSNQSNRYSTWQVTATMTRKNTYAYAAYIKFDPYTEYAKNTTQRKLPLMNRSVPAINTAFFPTENTSPDTGSPTVTVLKPQRGVGDLQAYSPLWLSQSPIRASRPKYWARASVR